MTQVLTKTLYEQDFHLWLTETAALLKTGQVERLDYENLIEEIEAMGRSEKHALESNLRQLLLHLLKWRYQPQKQTNSWAYSIAEHSLRLNKAFQQSPSLKRYFEEILPDCYQDARLLAKKETGLTLESFPTELPFKIADILNPDYLPATEGEERRDSGIN
ncbi:MAG: DUF29 family protein [Cyanobacteria bacterium RI_101]|nr:DUF29 family protein [Cyanobacteria bacterium RI_101]